MGQRLRASINEAENSSLLRREAASQKMLSPRAERRKITLATGVLRVFADDDEIAHEAPTDRLPSVELASSRA